LKNYPAPQKQRETSARSPWHAPQFLEVSNAYEEIIYGKGTWVIHMLREMLRQPGTRNPDERFVALLQTLVTKYAYRALSTDDFRHEVEAVMTPAMDLEGGRSMEWFFEEWVRGTGIPHYRVEFTAHHTEKGYQIRGKLFQTGVPARSSPAFRSTPVVRDTAALLGTVVAAGRKHHFTSSFHSSPQDCC